MRKLFFAAVIGGSLLVALAGGSLALAKDDRGKGGKARATLSGYSETPSISTVAKGRFRAEIGRNGGSIDYRLSYEGIEGGTVTQAHIHLGERHTAGGVSAFLCGGGDKPACPTPGGTVSGTIDAADIVGPAAQGILAGQLNELVRAIRAGATYVNVHSTTYPAGEIRGQVKSDRRKHRDDDD